MLCSAGEFSDPQAPPASYRTTSQTDRQHQTGERATNEETDPANNSTITDLTFTCTTQPSPQRSSPPAASPSGATATTALSPTCSSSPTQEPSTRSKSQASSARILKPAPPPIKSV